MAKLLVRLPLLVLFSLLSCDAFDIPTRPGDKFPPPPPPLPQPEIVAAPFDFASLRGYSAFALVGCTREERRALLFEGLAHGFNTPRVCGETEYWDGGPDDDHPRFPRNLGSLRELLDDAARISGVQVLLVPNCTLRDSVPVAEQIEWDRQVRALVVATGYPNIAVEVVNEFWHPDSLIGKQPIAAMIAAWNAAGIPTGTDDSVCRDDFTLQHRLFGHAAFYSFHPCRTIQEGLHSVRPWDPDFNWLRRLQGANGSRPVMISESVCYADPNEYGGLCTADRSRVQNALNAALATGVGWVYHSREGLRAKPPYSWWPEPR